MSVLFFFFFLFTLGNLFNGDWPDKIRIVNVEIKLSHKLHSYGMLIVIREFLSLSLILHYQCHVADFDYLPNSINRKYILRKKKQIPKDLKSTNFSMQKKK